MGNVALGHLHIINAMRSVGSSNKVVMSYVGLMDGGNAPTLINEQYLSVGFLIYKEKGIPWCGYCQTVGMCISFASENFDHQNIMFGHDLFILFLF